MTVGSRQSWARARTREPTSDVDVVGDGDEVVDDSSRARVALGNVHVAVNVAVKVNVNALRTESPRCALATVPLGTLVRARQPAPARSPSLNCRRLAADSLAIALAVLASAGCGVLREQESGQKRCPDFAAQVAPVIERRCAGCHSGQTPAAGYSVDSHLAVLARREDGSARLVPGDESSSFLAAARGELAGHEPLPREELNQLRDWAVRCRAAPANFRVHLDGWMSPPDREQFHGTVLRRQAYQLAGCRECHGAELEGGSSGIACGRCHPKGVLACDTCHGASGSSAPHRDLSGARGIASIGVGAHRAHLVDGVNHRAFGCDACHPAPRQPEDEGHYQIEGAPDPAPAEVNLRPARGRTAVWDREAESCSASYCHAPSADDSDATNQSPRWTAVGAGQAACGSCHGIPPSGHAPGDCANCHRRAYAAGKPLPERHVNGTVEVGEEQGSCSGCHGDGASPAPPSDLAGQTSENVQSVGAHRAHVQGRQRLSAPMQCEDCHLAPRELGSPGHLDSAPPAEVFPAAAGVATLARADGASPSYDSQSATCAGVYCHGSGAKLSQDAAAGRLTSPRWTGGVTQAVCGACHGIPPVDGVHAPGLRLDDCARCHPATITSDGAIRVVRDPVTGQLRSTHIDGQVQAVP